MCRSPVIQRVSPLSIIENVFCSPSLLIMKYFSLLTIRNICLLAFYGSFCLMGFSILMAFVLSYTLLELPHSNHVLSVDSLMGVWFPTSILLTLSYIGFQKDHNIRLIFIQIVGTFLLAFFVFIFYTFASFGSGMCAWTNAGILFRHKTDSGLSIIERSFGCGAVDSSPPIYQTFRRKELSFGLLYITQIDTSDFNPAEWHLIPQTNN